MFGSSSLFNSLRYALPVRAQSTNPEPSSSWSSAHLALLKSFLVTHDHSFGDGNLRSSHSCCTPNAIASSRPAVVQKIAVYFPASQNSLLIHSFRSVVRNRAMGRLVGEERNGSCGLEVRVFCVKGRGTLGGRKGRRKSILRIGSRGRMLERRVHC